MKHISRQELYHQVWAQPMTRVAQNYGLSDRGLAKLCERYGIPTPPRGYWAKKAAGQKVKKPPLIALETGEPETIRLLQRARPTSPDPASDVIPPDIEEAIAREGLPAQKISVAKSLTNPHPIVGKIIREAERSYGYFGEKPERRTSLETYRLRVLSALLKAFEARGFKAHTPEHIYARTYKISCGRDELYLSVQERIQQTRRKLTDEERAQHWNQGQVWTMESKPTGLLRIRLNAHEGGSPLKDFDEEEPGAFTGKLNAIMAGIILAFWERQKIRLRFEEAEERRQAAAAEQAALQEQQRQAQLRLQALEDQATMWGRAQRLRAYIAAVDAATAAGSLCADPAAVLTWKDWAQRHADSLDPIKSGTLLKD